MFLLKRLFIVVIAMMAVACSSSRTIQCEKSHTLNDMNLNERYYERIDHKR